MRLLKRSDLRVRRKKESQLIHPLQQAAPAERRHDELPRRPVREGQLTCLEIRGESKRGIISYCLQQRPMRIVGKGHWQERILQRVAAKDVSEGRATMTSEAEIRQGPRRVLARRAAAEVAPGDQDPGAARRRLIQDEVGTAAPAES